MTTFQSTLIVNLTVLAVILGGDLGRRKVTTMRIVRPLIVVAVAMAIFRRHPRRTLTCLRRRSRPGALRYPGQRWPSTAHRLRHRSADDVRRPGRLTIRRYPSP